MPGATIEVISKIRKHPNADSLDLAEILGFQCVVPLGGYQVGQKIIFIHPDNVLPQSASWSQSFLKYAKTRVRAIKIRQEWSEGIVMDPSTLLSNSELIASNPDLATTINDLPVGSEISNILSITHYEVPEGGGGGGGRSDGGKTDVVQLPHNMPKTDEERWENLKGLIHGEWLGKKVDVSLKIDGQSWSAYHHLGTDEFGICGRRITHNIEDKNDYTEHIGRFDLKNKLTQYCQEKGVSLCIRGESYGKGIQKLDHNPHSKLEKNLAIFSVYLMDEHKYAHRNDPFYFTRVAADLGLPTVPILEENVDLTPELITKYSTGCDKVAGQPFEGVVIKGDDFSFKIINKNYDSKK
jgi:RNA ligase (TIGR02306 family)